MADASQQSGQSQWRVVVYKDSDAIETISIAENSLTIGRELDNDIALDDLEVSRHHARLTRRGEQLIIEDLNSANGTSVNNTPLTESYVLHPDDVIKVGSFTLKIEGLLQNIPQARIKTTTHAPSRPKGKSKPWLLWLIAGGVFAVSIMILIGLFVGGWFVSSRRSTVAETASQQTPTPEVPTIVLNQAPTDNTEIKVNQSVIIQAIASDPSGVTRMELWVNDRKVDEISTSLIQDAPSMAGAFQWIPDKPGTYDLEIHAFNRRNLASVLPVTTLIAIGNPPTPTAAPSKTPTPTITPLPPTFTPTPTDQPSPTPIPPTPTPASAWLIVSVPVLNVRTGPGTQYDPVGQLVQNEQVEIIGQANSAQGKWWQIDFASAPNGLGWASADSNLVTVVNTDAVPVVTAPPLPTATPTPTTPPSPTPTAIVPAATVIRAPSGKTLLIISNRSTLNQPARLTLSGGKSVGGGKEFDPPPNGEIQVVLEPDFYRALWSTPARGGFNRGVDFTAVAGKVMIMWIVPEEGLTETEVYDQLTIGEASPPIPAATTIPAPPAGDYNAPPGKALFVAANRSIRNDYAVVTLSGGNFAGGRQITLDANTETPLELLPGNYRAVWNAPVHGGFNAGREFTVSSGEVILSWIIPEDGQVFMQFPGQPAVQVNN